MQHKTWQREQSAWYATLGRYQVRAVREVARGASLLDLACGDGSLTALMAANFGRVVGVDGA